MHGIVGRASITIIACKASYCVVTLHNKLKHLDIDMCVDIILIKQSVHISKTSSMS